MIQYIVRQAKRFAVLLPGILIAYFSVRTVVPYFDQRLPLSLAILLAYVLAAYVMIPATIRLYRVIRPPDHLPLYCVTPDGFASDPLNIGIIATRQELIEVMGQAGWHVADPHTIRNMLRVILSVIFSREYPNAPMSSLYLFGRKQDLGFEIPTGDLGGRHHVRFWATTYEKKKVLNIHGIHWHHRRAHIQDDELLWVGAASLDVGFNFIRHNFQLTHMIDPDTNRERELIIRQLRAAERINKIDEVQLDDPYRLVNRTWRGSLHTDGIMAVIRLQRRRKS